MVGSEGSSRRRFHVHHASKLIPGSLISTSDGHTGGLIINSTLCSLTGGTEANMNELSLDMLKQRLDRLERENCWFKRVGAVVFMGVVAVVLMGQAKSSKVEKIIEAQKFVVRDVSGKSRAVLGMGEDGVVLVFTDNKERPRIFLKAAHDGEGAIAFFQKAGKGRSVFSDRGLWLVDKDGKERAELAMNDDEPRLALFDRERKTRALVELLESGDPKLTLVDKYGTHRATLGLLKGQPVIAFLDGSGKLSWNAP